MSRTHAAVVTGAAGYIGSHLALALMRAGVWVLGIDDLSRGNWGAVQRLADADEHGRMFEFECLDLNKRRQLRRILKRSGAETVFHTAALAYVGESMERPLDYWRTNLAGTLTLCQAMESAGIHRLVFSSSCATYGDTVTGQPIDEHCRQRPLSAYGQTKLACESMLMAQLASDGRCALAILRYFNVAGCGPTMELGEDHRPETHLVPLCLDVALGHRDSIDICGDRFATPDGTCVRDFVHVLDVAAANVIAAAALTPETVFIANVGTGRGHSVLEVIDTCRRVTGHPIPARVVDGRAGDPAFIVADTAHLRLHGWQPRFADLETIVRTAWEWKRQHPNGYARGLRHA